MKSQNEPQKASFLVCVENDEQRIIQHCGINCTMLNISKCLYSVKEVILNSKGNPFHVIEYSASYSLHINLLCVQIFLNGKRESSRCQCNHIYDLFCFNVLLNHLQIDIWPLKPILSFCALHKTCHANNPMRFNNKPS